MLNWIQEYWVLGLIALLIGIATGWWIWAQRAAAPAPPHIKAARAAPLQPVRPEIVAAQPAQFVAEPVAAPPEPVVTASPGPAIAVAVGTPDNLMLLKGVGPKLNTLLTGLGIIRFDQIAAWSTSEITAVDGRLGNFAGRVVRDNWVDQAGFLARGDKAGFEAKYGALGSEL